MRRKTRHGDMPWEQNEVWLDVAKDLKMLQKRFTNVEVLCCRCCNRFFSSMLQHDVFIDVAASDISCCISLFMMLHEVLYDVSIAKL